MLTSISLLNYLSLNRTQCTEKRYFEKLHLKFKMLIGNSNLRNIITNQLQLQVSFENFKSIFFYLIL